ncbi:MAG: hypothetical protein WEB00_15470 [Dehalococcoidia bacterium]
MKASFILGILFVDLGLVLGAVAFVPDLREWVEENTSSDCQPGSSGCSDNIQLVFALMAAIFIVVGATIALVGWYSSRLLGTVLQTPTFTMSETGQGLMINTGAGSIDLSKMLSGLNIETPTSMTTHVVSMSSDSREEALKERGVDCWAVVADANSLGVTIGEQTLYQVELDLRVEGKAPERVSHHQLVPVDRASRLTPGASLPVRVDRDNPSILLIDWDRI